jgi:hypothetical protein
MEAIKTFEDAAKALGISPEMPNLNGLPEKYRRSLLADYQLTVITEALNEGWVPNWSNYNEYKYILWFDKKGLRSGLSFYGVGHWRSGTDVGSRLCFKSAELAKYSAAQFPELWSDFMNHQNFVK